MGENFSNKLRFGPFEADLHTRELWKHGVRIKLVGQPFEVLSELLSKPGQLVTREELRARLWPGDTFVDFNHGLNAAVNKLREALCDSAEDPRYIETLPRRGYRFIATVEGGVAKDKAHKADDGLSEGTTLPQLDAGPSIASEQAAAVATCESSALSQPSSLSQASTPLETEREPGPRPRWLKLLVPVLAVLGGLVLPRAAFMHSRAMRKAPPVARGPAKPIVPLTNLADPTSDPAFSSDGKRVAFRRQGYAPGTSGIFVKTIGSPQLVQLTDDPADCCPAWSPNGRLIAFSHFSDGKHVIYAVPAAGGALRKLYSTEAGSRRGDLDWSPDGNSVAFAAESSQKTSSIFLLALRDLTARRVTETPLLNNDWGPAFSPDGQRLAFVRTRETGLPEDIMVMPAAGGESRVLVSFHNGILGPPAWTADSQSVVFASGNEPGLLRVSVSGGEITSITDAGTPTWHPAIARTGDRLAYLEGLKAVSIWQMDFSKLAAPSSQRVVVTDTGRNEGAQVSPDGKKLVFMSSRAGKLDIWISDRDGSNAVQLTDMGVTGTPRWSPDSHSIAFDAGWRDHGAVFVVDVTGQPRPLVYDNFDNLVPNWSRDGKWIYFASDRTGNWQVWKVPSAGGGPVQVTARGGFAAYESSNGKMLYYSKHNMPNPDVWSVPVGGGTETPISPLVRPEDWANWAPVDRGIYFVEVDTTGKAQVMFFDFASGQATRMAALDKLPFWLSASPDGKSVLYEHLDQENSHVMLLEGFR